MRVRCHCINENRVKDARVMKLKIDDFSKRKYECRSNKKRTENIICTVDYTLINVGSRRKHYWCSMWSTHLFITCWKLCKQTITIWGEMVVMNGLWIAWLGSIRRFKAFRCRQIDIWCSFHCIRKLKILDVVLAHLVCRAHWNLHLLHFIRRNAKVCKLAKYNLEFRVEIAWQRSVIMMQTFKYFAK